MKVFSPGMAASFGISRAAIAAADLASTAPVMAGLLSHNFHAFSYRGQQPVINQRVINETATIVDYVNAHILPAASPGP